MVDIVVTQTFGNTQAQLELDRFLETLQGRTVANAQQFSEGIRIKTYEGDHIDITTDNVLRISLSVEPENEETLKPIRIKIINEHEVPLASLVARRINELVQFHSIEHLINTGRMEELSQVLKDEPDADLEYLISEDERLYLFYASTGSFWVTVGTKVAKSYRSIIGYIAVLVTKGSEGLETIADEKMKQEKLKTKIMDAESDIKKEDARKRKVEADILEEELEKKAFDNTIDKINKILEIIDPHARKVVLDRYIKSLSSLNPKLASSPEITDLLPPPSKE